MKTSGSKNCNRATDFSIHQISIFVAKITFLRLNCLKIRSEMRKREFWFLTDFYPFALRCTEKKRQRNRQKIPKLFMFMLPHCVQHAFMA